MSNNSAEDLADAAGREAADDVVRNLSRRPSVDQLSVVRSDALSGQVLQPNGVTLATAEAELKRALGTLTGSIKCIDDVAKKLVGATPKAPQDRGQNGLGDPAMLQRCLALIGQINALADSHAAQGKSLEQAVG